MKCRKCGKKIKDDKNNEDIFEGDLCEDCFLKKLFPENDEQEQSLSKFEDLSLILDGFEAIILKGEILNKPVELVRFEKMMRDVENAKDLSVSERNVLSGRIVYLNAEVHI